MAAEASSLQSRYELLPGLLLGFHGTDEETAEKVLSGNGHLTNSTNEYDWLGHGIYFWEYSPQRALDFAIQSMTDPKVTKGAIKKPAVVGAVIDPGLCLNLLDASAIAQLKLAYEFLEFSMDGKTPKNKGDDDLRARYLDCAVIETIHQLRREVDINERDKGHNGVRQYDTVRGAFWEGNRIYPDAGFREKNHVQICVINKDCIKGYFRPIQGKH